MKLLIEPHYVGNIDFYMLLMKYDVVVFEVEKRYIKQTFRNRTQILSSSGMLNLTVPVITHSNSPYKEVKIDNTQSWLRDHKGAFFSCYGKAPFFEFFAAEFQSMWQSSPTFLIDLNMHFFLLIKKLLRLDIELEVANKEDTQDFTNRITPKTSWAKSEQHHPNCYQQMFGNQFVDNLSIIDMLLCVGPNMTKETLITRNTLFNW